LESINPQWEDEEIFQETRKIVIAQYTHIIYSEWLPITIGKSLMNIYDLNPLKNGYFKKYDKFLYPNIANEFSTAAFRFGHNLIRSHFSQVNDNNTIVRNMSIIDTIFNPILTLDNDGLDSFARGCKD
jgi:peroxidase